MLDLDEKVQAFADRMLSIGYSENINIFSIRSLIDIPDLKEFFDWFLSNINENCVLTSEQKYFYKEKESKGQVVYDIEKLESTNKVINEEFPMEHTNIDLENELIMQEIEILSAQLNSKQNQKAILSDELALLKKKNFELEAKQTKLESTIKFRQNKLKTINQNMNKRLLEFQAKLGSEDKFNQKICTHLNEIEASTETYIQSEKTFLDKISEYVYMEFDYNNLDKFSDMTATKSKMENIEKELKIMHAEYPPFMDAYFAASLGYKVAQCSRSEMSRILEHTKGFFEYTHDQLDQNETNRGNVQNLIAQNQTLISNFREHMVEICTQIQHLYQTLADLKVQKLLQYDMDQRQIELNLFLNKQEKLMKLIGSQNDRMNCLNNLGQYKIEEIESLKTIFEELIQNKSILSSKSNQSVLAASSFYSGNVTQSCNVTQANNGMNSFSTYNTSFSASMANLLSSTAYPSSGSPPSMMRDPFANENTPPMNMFKIPKLPHSTSLTGFNKEASPQLKPKSGSQEVLHIINKFLICVLSHLKINETAQKHVQLENQISLNFADNLKNFASIHEKIGEKYKSLLNANIRQNYETLYNIIENSIAYCYEKDVNSVNNNTQHVTHKFDFSNIKIQTARFLEEPLNELDKEQEELEGNLIRILKVINNERGLLESNSLEVLKRNLFIYFINQPDLMEKIVQNLNQIITSYDEYS